MNKINELEENLINEIKTSSLDHCVDVVLDRAKFLGIEAEAILDLSMDYYGIDKFDYAYVLFMVAVGLQQLIGNKRNFAYCYAGRAAFYAGIVGINLFPKDASVIFYFSLYVSKRDNMREYINKYKEKFDSKELIDNSKEKTAITYYVYAKLLQFIDKLDESEHLCEKSIELDPKCAEAHYGYANLLYARSSVTRAEKHYRNAIKLKPYELIFHNNYANLLLKNERNSESEKEVLFALRKDPKNFYANATYGYLLMQEGSFDEAIEKYMIAIKNRDFIEPFRISTIFNNLGLCYWRKGKKRDAENSIENAARIDLSNTQAIRNLRIIRKIKQNQDEHFTKKDILAELILILFLIFLIIIFYIERAKGLEWDTFSVQSMVIVGLIVFILIRHDLRSFNIGTEGVKLEMNDQSGIAASDSIELEESY